MISKSKKPLSQTVSPSWFQSTVLEARQIKREWRTALGAPAIARRLYKNGVAFVHVPKCAGRSVERGLRKAFRWSRGHVHAGVTFDQAAELLNRPISNQDDRQNVLAQASDQRASVYAYHLASGVKCVTGHAPVNAALLNLYRDERAFVTVLRDPVERFMSHFNYSYQAEGQGRIEIELDAFVQTERARTFGSMYEKYFAHQVSGPAEPAIKACLEQFSVVGFVDQMPLFERNVRNSLGRSVSFGHINATSNRKKPKRATIDPVLLTEVERLCTTDIAIYEWARGRFA